MIIRLAVLPDIPHILEIISSVLPALNAAGNFQWDSSYPTEGVFIDDIALNQLWVVEIEGNLAGICAITTDQYQEYTQVGWDIIEPAIVVHRLAVHLDFQGKGIAKALMIQAENEALRRQIAILRVDTNSINCTAQQLFLKLGYLFSGEIALEFRPGLRFYCYEKRLQADSRY